LLTDQVVSSVDHPVIVALLLGKMADASERGVQLQIRPDSYLRGMRIDPHDAVTMLGNLIDNAIDATGECARPRHVAVELRIDDDSFRLQVDDSGPGLSQDQRELAFRRGWSTKTADNARFGRGIGLALVVQLVRRHSGRIEVGTSELGGASFMIGIDTPAPREPA
jgi:two-component system CitB family sensor kinase